MEADNEFGVDATPGLAGEPASPAEQPEPPAEQPEPAAEQPEPAAEQPEPAAEQPEPAAEPAEPAAEPAEPVADADRATAVTLGRLEGPEVGPVDLLPAVRRSLAKRAVVLFGASGVVVALVLWRRRHR